MFIKNIIISGFRSYREQSFPDGISPKTNVIVGKNGSGKSNFFAAVQFVLNERYANLRATERKELFHVGSGRPALSIFVEIVFDNSDGRLVIPGRAEEKEVRIRRTVGLKQDEFRVNDRKFTAAEVHQLLESAGFSSSNPYYIVEQGKIVHLANMSEEDRYQLIKDVAGTKVYEARRTESERALHEAEGKQKQIDESIGQLEERLKDLENETKELKEFQNADHEKKCIEYCIFNTELEHAKEGLVKLEAEWNTNVSRLNENQDSQTTVEQQTQACESALTEIKTRITRLEAERKSVEKELADLDNRQAVAEVDASDAAGRRSRIESERASLQKELSELEKALVKTRDSVSHKRHTLQANETTAKNSLSDVDQKQAAVERLQEKRNRTKLFKNRAERDNWITSEIEKNEEIVTATRAGLETTKQEIAEVDASIKSESKKLKETTTVSDNVDKDFTVREEKIAAALKRRNELNQERRNQWQLIHDQESCVQRAEESLQSTRRQLERTVRLDIRQGLQSLKEILAEMKPDVRKAVHGPLVDLISVEEGYNTAVEVTAGNALFNVVVDSFDVSAMLLEKMNKERKPGRISFFPMDTIKTTPKSIPTTAVCSPLIAKIAFADKFSGVIAEVFGRTAVATTLEAGATLVKEIQCDVVTLDGDQLGRKGGITGGFIDRRNMKLVAYAREKQLCAEVTEQKSQLEKMCQRVAALEQRITEILNELEVLRSQNTSTEKQADDNLREARQREDRLSRLKTRKDNLLSARSLLQKNIEGATELIKRLHAEMSEEFKSTWTPEEERTLEKLTAELAELKVKSASQQADALRLATEVQLLEDTVQHLERRKAVVADRIREIGWAKHATDDLDNEHTTIKTDFSSFTQRLAAIEKALEAAAKEQQKAETQLESLRSRQLSSAMTLQERKDMVDRSQAQRSLLIQRRDDALQKMRKLGVVPKGIEKYSGLSLGKLMHQLKLVNEGMKRFSHVNRKAADQHTSLLDTKTDLVSQRDNLNKELKSIYDLMDHLDRKKDEAIERTYKQIQYQFEEVFRQLVSTNGSSAELQLVKRSGGSESRSESATGSYGEAATAEDPYVAARIRVSFGMGAAVSELEQLSGGQKSLVALALIFAIQRCDPAPFYLFDEIDAALDAEYRTAVARMIEKQSEECQFLIATFKAELLSVADRVLGIFFHNKVSRIQTISMDEGVRLLKQAALEERKRGREEADMPEAE